MVQLNPILNKPGLLDWAVLSFFCECSNDENILMTSIISDNTPLLQTVKTFVSEQKWLCD
ncbi:MAG: hypothetical protein ThorAB25_18340 [Candidatus Thorarchaeota archaeon AB_25]|nr:MAG: hypothetical protein ThorAB25_18340 [Candidatus Thorarchaeota archaeon AB_25]